MIVLFFFFFFFFLFFGEGGGGGGGGAVNIVLLILSRVDRWVGRKREVPEKKTPGVDFTKGFKTWHKFSTEIWFMFITIIVLFIAHEFITGKF